MHAGTVFAESGTLLIGDLSCVLDRRVLLAKGDRDTAARVIDFPTSVVGEGARATEVPFSRWLGVYGATEPVHSACPSASGFGESLSAWDWRTAVPMVDLTISLVGEGSRVAVAPFSRTLGVYGTTGPVHSDCPVSGTDGTRGGSLCENRSGRDLLVAELSSVCVSGLSATVARF